MDPLVSIIMGAYNEESTIHSCIKSIQNQTYSNWEFLICDDCSTDSTSIIIRQYAEKDDRIKLISNKVNMRLAASLNNCLKYARGEYIARMDSDDESLPQRIEQQVKFLEKNQEIDCVGCARIIFDETGDRGIRKGPEYPKEEILLTTTPFAHPTIMVRRGVYEHLHGYTESQETMRAEDLDFWARFFDAGYKGYNLQIPLYRYHESEDDLKKRSLKAAFETSKVYIKAYKTLGFHKYKYLYAIKPIIAALVPNHIMDMFYKSRLEQ